MPYYKVVNKNLQSCCSPDSLDWYDKRPSVQYKMGEWVDAPLYEGLKSLLFVFDDLENAILFCNKKGFKWRIFECEVKDPTQFYPCDTIFSIDRFWQLFFANKNELEASPIVNKDLPSILCSSVKLIREVENVVQSSD